MTTITTYLELKANIQDYAKRGDIASKIDTFIDLAETDIWEKLRVREMEARAIASTSTTSRFLALPSGFLEMRRLNLEYSTRWVDLEYKVPEALYIIDQAGVPGYYTVGTQLEFNRISDTAYTVEMKYWKKLDPLSAVSTNDILVNYPMIYLAGAMKHFGLWSVQDDVAAKWDGVFDEEIARANRQSRKGRYGSAPSKRIPGMVV